MGLDRCILAYNVLPAQSPFRLCDPEEIRCEFFATHVVQNLAPFGDSLIDPNVFRVECILPQ